MAQTDGEEMGIRRMLLGSPLSARMGCQCDNTTGIDIHLRKVCTIIKEIYGSQDSDYACMQIQNIIDMPHNNLDSIASKRTVLLYALANTPEVLEYMKTQQSTPADVNLLNSLSRILKPITSEFVDECFQNARGFAFAATTTALMFADDDYMLQNLAVDPKDQ